MIQRINKKSDLVVQLDIDLSNVAKLEIEYFTDESYKCTFHLSDIDVTTKGYFIYLGSDKLADMPEGQLKSIIKYSMTNTNYSDSNYDLIINLDLNVWLF